MRKLLLAVLCTVALTTAVTTSLSQPHIPRCQEDEVLVGVGDFSHGMWDSYRCQNLD